MTKFDDQLSGLATMSPAQLRAEWRRVYKEPPPPLSHDLLRRGIAHRLQERMHGSLPAMIARELGRLAKRLERDGDCAFDRTAKPGTRLVRDWHGKSHHVMILEKGFLFEDRHYASLTRIAFAITGAKWSGPRFFGLKTIVARHVAASIAVVQPESSNG